MKILAWMMVLGFAVGACGRQETPEGSSPLEIPLVIEEPDIHPSGAARLDFRSEQRLTREAKANLAFKLGWSILGFAVDVEQTVSTIATQSVEIMKYSDDSLSPIFRDDLGTLAVGKGEESYGRCDYGLTARMQVSKTKRMSLGSLSIEGQGEVVKLLDVSLTDKAFAISDGAKLEALERYCSTNYPKHQEHLEADLHRALRMKLVVEDSGDSRIEALHTVLEGGEANVKHHGSEWWIGPTTVRDEGQGLVVEGRVEHHGWVSDHNYTYRYGFDADGIKLSSMEMSPRGTDANAKAALELAGFVALNSARWVRRQGKTFTIDTSLLGGTSE